VILGKANGADAKTSLTASGLDDRALAITNLNTGLSATALGLNVAANRPPLIVNSATKVTNLNADLVDGFHATGLPYWKVGGNAGTTPSTQFIGTTDNVPLNFRVNGSAALRLVPGEFGANLIGGANANRLVGALSGATVLGGFDGSSTGGNTVTGSVGSVLGGAGNTATNLATVLGGQFNRATGINSIAGGSSAEATDFFAVALGNDVHARASGSYTLGQHASAFHSNSFVWNGSNHGVSSFGADTFTVASTGGTHIISGFAGNGLPNAGVTLASGAGSWGSLSDRVSKRNLARIDRTTLLAKLDRIPVTSWSYKAQKPSIRHLGPMAQDFYSAFGLGEDNRHIDTIDSEGVALAAIQGLYRQNQALMRRLSRLERQVRRLSAKAR
jgi:hypothetical protein